MSSVVVFSLTAVPERLRGALSRWCVEVDVNLYVGSLSGRVRDELWTMIRAEVGDGSAACVFTARNEQGWVVRTAGPARRRIIDLDGMLLATHEYLPRPENSQVR